jgi:hypothetical protein
MRAITDFAEALEMEAGIDPGIARYDRSLASCRIQVVLELALVASHSHGQKMHKQMWVAKISVCC